MVVNLKKNPARKWVSDARLKLSNTLPFLAPLVAPGLRDQLDYEDEVDKRHIDEVIEELAKLREGKSEFKHCEDKQFDWKQIHFKGLEFLDTKMKAYFYQKLSERFGEEAYNTQRDLNVQFFSLKTPDGAELDSVEIPAAGEKDKPISQRKFVITSLARDQNYINWIRDLRATSEKLEGTAISFNYRGVDLSRGMVWTEADMVKDVMAQVQRLIEMGAKPENICLDGMCVGAAISTLAAAKLHEKGLPVKLNNERSFSSGPDFIFGSIAPSLDNINWFNPLHYLRFLLAGVAYLIMRPLLWLSNWEGDAGAAWKKIPDKDKIHSVIRDPSRHIFDGVIHDKFSSIAAIEDARRKAVLKKLFNTKNGVNVLTEEDKEILKNADGSTQFTPSEAVKQTKRYKGPHFVSRHDLVATLGHTEPYTNHDYFIDTLKAKFERDRLKREQDGIVSEPLSTTASEVPSETARRRPLIIACSGGAGHISAAKGIVDELSVGAKPAEIPLYRAVRYQDKPFSLRGGLIRFGVWIMSVPYLGAAIKGVCRLFKLPVLPSYDAFHAQLKNISQNESDGDKGRERPYVDMLLDVYPTGYEFTAVNNAAHLSLGRNDIKRMISYKGKTEEQNYQAAFDHIYAMLVDGAKKGKPYTAIVSTQALSLEALCDAVICYNEVFLPEFNSENHTVIAPAYIQQYMTDLPAIGCAHFMQNLSDLTDKQRSVMEVGAVYMSSPIKAAFFGEGHGFKAVHSIDPRNNPMIRAGFKAPSLKQYTDKSTQHELSYKAYAIDEGTGRALYTGDESVTVKPDEKVASIMIGS